MIDKEILAKIILISNRIAPKYAFGIHSADDMIQEAIILGLDALSRWDRIRPLDNFLSVHISNRLRNFQRDNGYRFKDSQTDESRRLAERRRLILEPIPLERTSPEGESSMAIREDFEDNLIIAEYKELIDKNLPRDLRLSWLRLLDGAYISPAKREILESTILSIIRKDSFDD